jgi:protein gp37
MSRRSSIEWTDATWNPVTGCTEVSEGCRNCYARRFDERFGRDFHKVTCHPDRLRLPLSWKRPRRIFVNSMSDLFHENVSFDFVDQVFAVMAHGDAAHHIFQILTKRPDRMAEYLAADRQIEIIDACSDLGDERLPGFMPLPNVWLGISCEDQATLDERIRHLPRCRASVRFLSCEPLLSGIKLPVYATGVIAASPGYKIGLPHSATLSGGCGIDWVIVGGESGPGARPMHPDWVRSIRDQCQAAGVPFFFKQWGAWRPSAGASERYECIGLDGDFVDPITGPDAFKDHWAAMSRVGKNRAGRRIDAREWNDFPAAIVNPISPAEASR